ncbi:MarR family transcriptional regulator [Rhizobium sp. TRM96647]|uniref:MarR family winged helix-turn-helix transcriptional regulator n=1 Tax=unclassified Rhizobium TaxID=2613769 RepID=UPI0021E6F081|nr:MULTISPECIES: MarR family transcriptional regulator [unclassified Rhizobium]MCV3738251.1 MarR family transcriptional regulator [Rhizobium sp. TRM96647]MCV3760000.1 MarR family transcriptional regulator [Rhizobium sp. TRM96650]
MTDTLEIAQGMFKIYHQVSRLVNECMMDEGVSLARSKFLFLLSCEGPQRSTDIAAALGFAPRTVTEAIDGLERDKLVVREPDPKDRRAKIVSITETGLAVMNAAMEPKHKIVKAIFEVLDEEQKAQLAEILDCLSAQTQELQRARDEAEEIPGRQAG